MAKENTITEGSKMNENLRNPKKATQGSKKKTEIPKPIMVSIGKNTDILFLLKVLAIKHKKTACAYLEALIYREAKKHALLDLVSKK